MSEIDAMPGVAKAMLYRAYLGILQIDTPKWIMTAFHNGFDYDMTTKHVDPPEITITERVSSNRRMTVQRRLAELKGEIEAQSGLVNNVTAQLVEGNNYLQELKDAKKTKVDTERVAQLQDALEGWTERALQLESQLEKEVAKADVLKAEYDSLVGLDLNHVKTWVVKSTEL